MCGIAGFIGTGKEQALESMIACIRHRGPDDKGVWLKPLTNMQKNVGLAQARLSIIDLSPAGHQPMFSQDGDVAIIFNGEIYNFAELRDDLKARGYTFKSSSDTEVIIYLYQEFGEACFEKMNGMFAIALYDLKSEKLVLARDRLGKKPLFWSDTAGQFIFASELSALFTYPGFKPEIDLESLNKYFFYEYVPTPHTMLSGVYKLEAGHYLVYQNGVYTKTRFWDPHPSAFPGTFDEAKEKLDTLLADATKSRLVADVPVGIFLSGGIDSTTIAYYAAKASTSKIHTFSIGFEDKSFDETPFINEAAAFLKTEHHHKTLSAKETLEAVPKIFEKLDEPMADASIIPTYLLSKFARESVTVALGGDGGDELFAGYPTFQADKAVALYRSIPQALRSQVIEKLIRSLPVSHKNFSLDFKLKRFIESALDPELHRHHNWLSSFREADRAKLFSAKVAEKISGVNVYEDIERYAAEFNDSDIRNTILYLYERTYMMDGVMVKVDRASMMHALETRAPMLDYRIAELAHSLPYTWKQHGLTGKYILKDLMKDKLPHSIVYRKKKGFGIPLAKWLREDLRELCEQTLSKENIEKGGLFNYDYIGTLKKEHFEGKADHRKKLWTLMVFEMWKQRFLR